MSNIFNSTISTSVSVHHAVDIEVDYNLQRGSGHVMHITIKAKDGNDMVITVFSDKKISI